ncbi:MAG TPA: hypothetical protein VN894_21270 [Polyangiaceae bacterium]|nr:hypothetical protein [Polyangiaceae bacterium]
MKKIVGLLAPVLGSAVLLACTSTTSSPVVACGPDDVATTNWDVVVVTNYEAAWYYASLDAVPLGFYTVASVPVADATLVVSADGAATAVAAAVGQYFPNGCATATASGNVTTFTLNNCTGPLGLVRSTGTVTATFTLASNAIQIQLAGNKISANGATVNLATTGTLTAANGQKTLQANSATTGTGPDGNGVAHSGTYTLVWPTGDGCATINGTLSGIGTGAYAGTSTQITNYVACAGKCPQSGTATSSFNGGTATLTFNGSSNAQCSASNGTSASVPLHCP